MKETKEPQNSCWLNVVACGALTFLAILTNADNIDKHVSGTPGQWLFISPIAAMTWAYLNYCVKRDPSDE